MQNTIAPGGLMRWSAIAGAAVLVAIALIPFSAQPARAATAYYVSSSTGSDTNSGTSSGSPWRTLAKVNSATTYGPGDSILLKSGDTWIGETLAPNGSGTAGSPILISNYGSGDPPHINRNDPTNLSSRGIVITDDDGIKITNLEVSGAFYGILFEYGAAASGFDYVWVEDVEIHDMNAKQETYGDPWAIGVGVISWNTSATQVLRDITFRDIVSDKVTAAIWIGKRVFDAGLGRERVSNDTDKTNYQNVDILNFTSTRGRSLQVVTQNATDVLWDNVQVKEVGYGYPAGQGSAGSGLEHTDDVTIQNSTFADVAKGNDHGSGDGDGFDLEGDTIDSTFSDVLFQDSEGPGLMFYSGATGTPHTNVVIDDSTFNSKAWGGPTTPKATLWFTGTNSTNNTGTITDTKFYLSAWEALTSGSADIDMRGNSEYRWAQTDDKASQLTYSGSWSDFSDSLDYLGTERNSKTTNNYVEYAFYGSAVEWIGARNFNLGKADVILDGVEVVSNLDLYAPEKRYRHALYSNLNLTLGFHTLRIVVDGTKNTSSSDYYVNVDYVATAISPVRVYDNAETGSIAYSGTWTTWTDIGDYGSTEHNSNTTNNTATLSFTGTGVQWVGARYNTYGKAEVFVDGVSKGIVDQYAASKQHQQILYEIAGLSSGAHTIQLKVTGTKNASSSGYYVNVDDFRVVVGNASQIDDRASGITYATGTWSGYDGDPWYTYGGTETNGSTTSHYVEYTWTGTSIAWIGAKNSNLGRANVYIDGVPQIAGIDLYSATKQYQQPLYVKTGLSNASHTIRIEVAGTKNASSSGYSVNIDALIRN